MLLTSLFVLSYFLYKRYTGVKATKNELFVSLDQKSKELQQKKFGMQLDVIVALAKSNSPEFLVLFQEVYPQFVRELKQLNPQISNSEIAFCAYAFLNFSTKEIADYTHVTIRAIQVRKNRIRKNSTYPPKRISTVGFLILALQIKYYGLCITVTFKRGDPIWL